MTKMKQTGLRKMTIRKASLNAVTVMGLTVVACTPSGSASSDTETTAQAPELLIPSTATLERVGELLYDPMADSIHPDPRMASIIRLGFQISQDPQTYASEFVGNDLTCGNCHLNAGQRDRALPLLGVAATFPQYRRRDDRLVSLEDRIAGCFKRSMNGTAPPYDHPVMLALDAYLIGFRRGFAMGERLHGSVKTRSRLKTVSLLKNST